MADVSTEIAIASTTLGSANSTITFSSIPSTYTDLRLVIVIPPSSTSSGNVFLKLNGASTGYSQTNLRGSGSAASSTRATSQTYWQIGLNGFYWTGSANYAPVYYSIDIFNYAGSTFKTSLISYSEDANGVGYTGKIVGLYQSTSTISSLAFSTDAGVNYPSGTTATLYGIL